MKRPQLGQDVMTQQRTAVCLFLAIAAIGLGLAVSTTAGAVEAVGPGVYVYPGDHDRGLSNNSWIVLDDYVVVVDANYPEGAAEVIAAVRQTTDKPVRFVVDTHFHPDHAFGNRLWADQGATIVAQKGTYEELKATGEARWATEAATRRDVAATTLKLPDVTYDDRLTFAGKGREVDLLYFGPAHTHGDTLVWLPKDRILMTGDVCVNGSFNYVADSDIGAWIGVLEKAKALGARIVVPGHGPVGGPEIIADQEAYFVELRRRVQDFIDRKLTPAEVKAQVPALAASLKTNPQIARFVPEDKWFIAHVDKIYGELSGSPLPQ